MLFKMIFIMVLALNSQANTNFSIIKSNDKYFLKSKSLKLELTYSGKPKIIKVSKDKNLTLVQYYSGSYGTSDIFKIENLIVIKDDKVLIDAPFKYRNKKLQPKWNIDHDIKIIEVKDNFDRNRKVSIK